MSSGILLAHDLTARSKAVTAAAADLAGRLGLAVTALHVIPGDELEKQRNSRPADSAFTDLVLEQLRGQLSTMVATELSESPGVEFSVKVIEGEPHRAVREYVERHQPEFTFIGIRNRSRVGKLLFGSVPQTILLGSTGKVIAVPIGD
jgi:nucleotide-binding universal stress UspA family protein